MHKDATNPISQRLDPDKELVSGFQNGDESCFDELVKKYQSKIYSLAFRLVQNSEDAGDLAQETFVRAYRGLPKFKYRSAFYTWLYHICINLCINFNKKSVKQQTISYEDVGERVVMNMPAHNTPENDLWQKGLKIALTSAINKLPRKQRAVFVLHQYQGLAHNEIAKIIKCSTGAVKAQYYHAVRKLRKLLQDWI